MTSSKNKGQNKKDLLHRTELSKSVQATLPHTSTFNPTAVQTNWEELEALYQACAEGILDIAEFAKSTQQHITNLPPQDIPAGAVTAIRGLARDLNILTTDLIGIHNTHKEKKGMVITDEEHAATIDVGMAYVGFQERFKAVTLTPVQLLSEAMLTAVEKQDLTNPDVISDAIIREEQPTQDTDATVSTEQTS